MPSVQSPSVLQRATGALRRRLRPGQSSAREGQVPLDSWLEHFYGQQLQGLNAACAGAGPEALRHFADLDADLWALLLSQQHHGYPHITALLPEVPDPALQALWTGTSGIALAAQSVNFYRRLCQRYAEHSPTPLEHSRVLDFGCGWGRLTRYLARDVEPGRLYGCDPVEQILDVCRSARVPALLARSDFLPQRLPFAERFDLAFSFSVFTHLSEAAHLACLQALHDGLAPGGILIVTVRPPHYLQLSELMRPLRDELGSDLEAALREPRYLFAPHPAAPLQEAAEPGDSTYGETVLTMAYIRERWGKWFELLQVDVLLGDLHQVMLTLRRR